MSFNTALSGLRAANTDLAVTGNNIANASTTGFKSSRAEFGDVYAATLVNSASVPGSGVLVTEVAQQFDQGNIAFTDNSLDLAVNGQGFFVLSDAGATAYTRAGNFSLDNQGFIVSNGGARLQGNPANSQGDVTDGVQSDLRVQTQDLAPAATSELNLDFNVDSREVSPNSGVAPPGTGFAAFDPLDANTFNHSTSQTVYDSLGNPHVMTQYFTKQLPDPTNADPLNSGVDNAWDLYVLIDGEQVGDGASTVSVSDPGPAGRNGFQIGFNSGGVLDTGFGGGGIYTINNWVPKDPVTGATNGAVAANIELNFTDATQFGGEFSVAAVDQNGFAPGRLAGVQVSDDGTLFARYTNGEALTLGRVSLANFPNPQGLNPLGDTAWGESFESGQPVIGSPQSGSLGALQAGALEESNVDLSEELVRLIIAQRNFQANSKTIETANTITQTIINLR